MKDYLKDILVRMAYHSSGIEGNTITLPQTVSIILEGTLPNQSKSIREFYEIENHKQTFEYILEQLSEKRELNIEMILKIHTLLTDRLQHYHGQFKTMQNAIVGAEFNTVTSQETPIIRQWIDNLNYRINSSKEEFFEILADIHIQFERIHPFSDGNGRTGRMILLYLSMLYKEVPIVIVKEKRAEYMEYLAEQDNKSLSKLLKNSYEYEKDRMKKFE